MDSRFATSNRLGGNDMWNKSLRLTIMAAFFLNPAACGGGAGGQDTRSTDSAGTDSTLTDASGDATIVADTVGTDAPALDPGTADTSATDTAGKDTAVADSTVTDTMVAEMPAEDIPVADIPVADNPVQDADAGPTCELKYTVPVSGWNYSCDQICAVMDACNGSDNGCDEGCASVAPNSSAAFGNALGDCMTQTKCSELPDKEGQPGVKEELAPYCMQQYFKASMGSLPADKLAACAGFDAKLFECGGSDEGLCAMMALIMRDEIWAGFKGCIDLSGCQAFFECMDEWLCWFPR
jgi:hypothetical protein